TLKGFVHVNGRNVKYDGKTDTWRVNTDGYRASWKNYSVKMNTQLGGYTADKAFEFSRAYYAQIRGDMRSKHGIHHYFNRSLVHPPSSGKGGNG
ncbi:MAG: hypothetical protein ACP5NO_08630, partial [Thermoplasmata archaeon]